MSEILLVITNMPNRESALKMAQQLVENRLAACVNVLGDCDSFYHWQDRFETAREVPLFIKTHAAAYPEVETAIRAAHPYELPEIIAVRVERGLKEYLAWVAAQTQASHG
jgi:periplasmic divalent cation tolerance protein